MTHRFQTSSPSSKTNHCKILTRRSFPNTCAFWHSNLHLPLSSARATPCTYHAHICNNTFLMASMRDQDLAHSLMLCFNIGVHAGVSAGRGPTQFEPGTNCTGTGTTRYIVYHYATYRVHDTPRVHVLHSARSSYKYRGYELMILASAGYQVWAIAISSDC